MELVRRKTDYLNDPVGRVFLSLALPLLLVYVLQIGTTALNNKIYSAYIGPDIFTLIGYLNTTLNSFTTISSGIAAAAWIKSAPSFVDSDRDAARRSLLNGICSILIVERSLALLLLLLTDPVLRQVHVPSEIFASARGYYISYLLLHCTVPLSSFFLTVLNGTGSTVRLFFNNLFTICVNLALTFVMAALCHSGAIGIAFLPSLVALAQLSVYCVLLRKDGTLPTFKQLRCALRPDRSRIGAIIRYGLLISLQNLFCTIGYLVLSVQANLCLSLEYVSVLGITLPFSTAMNALSTSITAFIPRNYAAKRYDRVNRFFFIAAVSGLLYAAICTAVYCTMGSWYYGKLWNDPQIIAYGTEVWIWQGIGMIPLVILFTFRFFLDAVGQSKLSLLSGVGELLGNLFCALWVIPRFGHIGRSISMTLGWTLAAVFLLTAYTYFWKRKLSSAALRRAPSVV